jgi:hypothetical protein
MFVNTANTKTTSPQAATWFACGVMLTLLNNQVQKKFMCGYKWRDYNNRCKSVDILCIFHAKTHPNELCAFKMK